MKEQVLKSGDIVPPLSYGGAFSYGSGYMVGTILFMLALTILIIGVGALVVYAMIRGIRALDRKREENKDTSQTNTYMH